MHIIELLENEQTTLELNKLSMQIVKLLVDEIISTSQDKLSQYFKNPKDGFSAMSPVFLNSYTTRTTGPVAQMIDTLSPYISLKAHSSTTLGVFQSPNGILIFLKENDYNWLSEALYHGTATNAAEVYDHIKQYTSVLTHELTHMYDYYQSHGRYIMNKKAKAAKASPDDHTLYLNSPHEINARYTALVHHINFKQSWGDFVSQFKNKFDGWSVLPQDDKRRLISRLAVEYQLQNNKPMSVDITPNINKLMDKLTAEVPAPFEVTYDHQNSAIKVYIPKASISKCENIFAPLQQLAKVYRKIIVVDGLTITEAKRLGFIKNKGTRRDFRFSQQWIYEPKR